MTTRFAGKYKPNKSFVVQRACQRSNTHHPVRLVERQGRCVHRLRRVADAVGLEQGATLSIWHDLRRCIARQESCEGVVDQRWDDVELTAAQLDEGRR